MNSKTQMASVSLVGAIPGLALSIVLVMALVNHFSPMTNMLRALAALTLLASVGLAMLPVVIMVFGTKTVKDKSEVDEESSEAAEEEEEEELVPADDDEEEFDLDEDVADEPDLSDDDFAEPEADADADDLFIEGDEEEFDMGLFEDEK